MYKFKLSLLALAMVAIHFAVYGTDKTTSHSAKSPKHGDISRWLSGRVKVYLLINLE